MFRMRLILPVLLLGMLVPTSLFAQDAIDKADTAWMLISSALVLLMVPGLALFYGGMVRSKNVLSSIMHSLIAMGLITMQWVIVGYSLAFGGDHWGVIGGLEHVLLNGVGMEPIGTIPALVFMIFQGMFAIITPALISGAVAERMKFSTYCVFILAWATLVYDPIAHWVWASGGWLFAMGALDFAGGTVVHLNSGISALVLALVIGARMGYKVQPMRPNNLVFTMLGAGLLWFGWFGFNAGSALSSGALAAQAFVTTHIAASAAAVAWTAAEWWFSRRPSMLGTASGLVAGLVVITPAAGFVSPAGAMLMGVIGGVVCYLAVLAKHPLGYDDSLDAFGIHGVGGMLGALLTGVFATTMFNPQGTPGLLEGNLAVMVPQILGVVSTLVYAGVMTWIIVKVLEKTMGLRVTEDQEREGLDINQHGEQGYFLT
ncbi:MAG: ammonium transporter [Candidatus Lambdaproteobacteria bacterium]|nr:ammonium transporter [Candidatus Lambdaproteobacteria bacterium]